MGREVEGRDEEERRTGKDGDGRKEFIIKFELWLLLRPPPPISAEFGMRRYTRTKSVIRPTSDTEGAR